MLQLEKILQCFCISLAELPQLFWKPLSYYMLCPVYYKECKILHLNEKGACHMRRHNLSLPNSLFHDDSKYLHRLLHSSSCMYYPPLVCNQFKVFSSDTLILTASSTTHPSTSLTTELTHSLPLLGWWGWRVLQLHLLLHVFPCVLSLSPPFPFMSVLKSQVSYP